jgi:glycerol-3-phosphate dehydrogenase subunit C
MGSDAFREGSLEAPTRHSLDWKNPDFYQEELLFKELERVYDICHGCRRCVNLCNAFPTLFDLVDESDTMEVDGVSKQDYYKVVDHCYLCDLCYMTKCPYVPPHEWNVDFPHLMLQAKAVKFKKRGASLRDWLLTSTDVVGNIAGIPVVSGIVNTMNKNKPLRKLMDKALGVHADAPVPEFHHQTLTKRLKKHSALSSDHARAHDQLRGRVALFATCYCNRNNPAAAEDLIAIFEHNKIPVALPPKERCCGMPKLELGDLESVEKSKAVNIPILAELAGKGWDIVTPIPSCVLMFKQELPLMFPGDEQVQKVKQAIYDPFEYLMLLHRDNRLDTGFKNTLGKIAYHVPCHQRVQNIGLKTRDILNLVPGTEINVIERCSGHNGTYAVKSEFHDISIKICQPVATRVKNSNADHYISDCPMAGDQISHCLGDGSSAESPFTLLRYAYGI